MTDQNQHSDKTFITNEGGHSLKERFASVLQGARLFDALSGYFYLSGFHAICDELEEAEKIRVLIGINTDAKTAQLVEDAATSGQMELPLSHSQAKTNSTNRLQRELEQADDTQEVEYGARKFLQWLKAGKLEVKVYPSRKLHAKLYIVTYPEGGRDIGRVITGSSNFTKAGFEDNLEFNVELKNTSDYIYAQEKFNELWDKAVDVRNEYIKTIQESTWLRDDITPYELYLKFLYEYFREDLEQGYADGPKNLPKGFKSYEYQSQAVANAKRTLLAHNGVFLSDVVGLGKTYMAAILASQFGEDRHLIIAPPSVLDDSNPSSWVGVFRGFNLKFDAYSIGKLDELVERGTENYTHVFIDEAHRFRNDASATYAKLSEICIGKRVILVTATPFNNRPDDLLSQIKLFQSSKESTIPGVPDLDMFFRAIRSAENKAEKQGKANLRKVARENAEKTRESVLKHIMVRRTRHEVETYFANDLKKQKTTFPKVEAPQALYYQFDTDKSKDFFNTVKDIAQNLKYARYAALLYLKSGIDEEDPDKQGQTNLTGFMKILLIKRFESSLYAFNETVDRFIETHRLFIAAFEKGEVLFSKHRLEQALKMLEEGKEDELQKLLGEGKAARRSVKDFSPQLIKDVTKDLKVLERIKARWAPTSGGDDAKWETMDSKDDPKLKAFMERLSSDPKLKGKVIFAHGKDANVSARLKSKLVGEKVVVFSESKDTCHYLREHLNKRFPGKVLFYSGSSGAAARKAVVANFDANASEMEDEYRILITTEALSEGVNLHRADVVINYDIPWNPTRLMQRVGRVNRVNTSFEKVYTFNFFPTEEANSVIGLEEAARRKINAFIELLGADAHLLTDDETIESHELFNLLMSPNAITGEWEERESELKYLHIIRKIRDATRDHKKDDTYDRIVALPKKARVARKQVDGNGQLLTYYRKGRLEKFSMADDASARELDFIGAARWLAANKNTPGQKIPSDFYDKLQRNKNLFSSESEEEQTTAGGKTSAESLLEELKATQKVPRCTDADKSYLQQVIDRIEAGDLPRHTIKTARKAVRAEIDSNGVDSAKITRVLKNNIRPRLLTPRMPEQAEGESAVQEVILSEYMIGK